MRHGREGEQGSLRRKRKRRKGRKEKEGKGRGRGLGGNSRRGKQRPCGVLNHYTLRLQTNRQT